MKGCLIAAGAVLLVLLLLGGCGVASYNGIVTRQETIQAAWSQIDNQYQRRFDLIPQLVSTVQGAADFEKSTLTELTEARASVGKVALPSGVTDDPAKLAAYMQAQDKVSSALSRLLVVAENYPSLKSTEGFLSLQAELAGTESRIAVARKDYIDSVNAYNVAIRRFPGSLVASVAGFEKHAQLEVPAGVQERPKVEFDSGKKKKE
ncbi:MAG: LemA family protein [Planctomycetes bacterium]|nr:LemA family protein [Planctomycetota bacterium]